VEREKQVDLFQANMLLEYAEIPVHVLYGKNTNNVNKILASSNLESLVMPYQANQLADLQL